MAHRFSSLQGSIDKLLGAEYFLAGLKTNYGPEVGYNINAFAGSYLPARQLHPCRV